MRDGMGSSMKKTKLISVVAAFMLTLVGVRRIVRGRFATTSAATAAATSPDNDCRSLSVSESVHFRSDAG